MLFLWDENLMFVCIPALKLTQINITILPVEFGSGMTLGRGGLTSTYEVDWPALRISDESGLRS